MVFEDTPASRRRHARSHMCMYIRRPEKRIQQNWPARTGTTEKKVIKIPAWWRRAVSVSMVFFFSPRDSSEQFFSPASLPLA